MAYLEPTDVLRAQHVAIRNELRRLEHALALLLGAADRGHAPFERSLEEARISGAKLAALIPRHAADEELLLSALLPTEHWVEAADILGEHGEMEDAYQKFLQALGELDRAAPEPERVRALAVLVHALSDRLGLHMRREEREAYRHAEESLLAEEKRRILVAMRAAGAGAEAARAHRRPLTAPRGARRCRRAGRHRSRRFSHLAVTVRWAPGSGADWHGA